MNVMTSVGAEAGLTAVPAVPGPARFTADEFERMMASGAFEDIWLQLVEGELQRMPPPGKIHGRLQVAVLSRLLRLVPEDRVFGDVAIRLADATVVGCDAAVLAAPSGADGDVDGAVSASEVLLVVEVAVSTLDNDLALKRRLYAAAGVPTYWVVDAARRVVHVFDRPEGGDYLGLSLARFGEPLAVPGTEGSVVVG